MREKTLARRILEKLDDAFPRKSQLHELRAALPEHATWLSTNELHGKLASNNRSGATGKTE